MEDLGNTHTCPTQLTVSSEDFLAACSRNPFQTTFVSGLLLLTA